MLCFFKFRPSGHSTDYVLVAEYRNKKEAEKALRRLVAKLTQLRKIEREDLNKYPFDWSVSSAYFHRRNKQVIFQVNSGTGLRPIIHVLKACGGEVDVREGQQALRISVKVPKGLNMEAAPLVLERDEVETLKLLKRIAGEPKIITRGDFDVWEWLVTSELNYSMELNELFYGDDFSFKLRENWKVRLLGKSLK